MSDDRERYYITRCILTDIAIILAMIVMGLAATDIFMTVVVIIAGILWLINVIHDIVGLIRINRN